MEEQIIITVKKEGFFINGKEESAQKVIEVMQENMSDDEIMQLLKYMSKICRTDIRGIEARFIKKGCKTWE